MYTTNIIEWSKIADFARSLGNPDDFIFKAEKDFDGLLNKYIKVRRATHKKHLPRKLDTSLSWQNFHPWFWNLCCFFILVFSGFRHTALRELRFYLEASARCYYIDTKYGSEDRKEKEKKLDSIYRKHLKFKKNLLKDLKTKKKELGFFYHELCNYVHLSEKNQTDALRDPKLNVRLSHPDYEQDIEMLERTFNYTSYLLSQSIET